MRLTDSFIDAKIIEELSPTEPVNLWVARTLLRIPETIVSEADNINVLVYQAYDSLRAHENQYISNYNAARSELVTTLLPLQAKHEKRVLAIQYEPIDDPSYWLATHVLGYTERELTLICGEFDHDDIGNTLIPLIYKTYKSLKILKLDDPLWQYYHRSKHLMIRYYLDAVYHVIS